MKRRRLGDLETGSLGDAETGRRGDEELWRAMQDVRDQERQALTT